MPDKNDHINYSLADIEKYLQGKMNATEMHQLEKAALQDPFLADAIEGYQITSLQRSHQHLEEIEQLIRGNKEETKIVPLFASKKWIWRIAVSVFAVVLISSIVWMINKKDTLNESVAKSTTPAIVRKDSAVITAKPDSSHAINNSTIASTLSKKKITIKIAEIKRTTEKDSLIKNEEAALAMKEKSQSMQDIVSVNPPLAAYKNAKTFHREIPSAPVGNNQALEGKVAGVSVTGKNKNIEGRVTDSTGAAVAGASILYKNNKAVSTDANGYFSLDSKDTVLNSTITSLGYTSANAKLSNSRFNNITLNQSTQNLNEVVVIGYGTSRKKDVTGSVSSVAMINKVDSLSPEGGWDKFRAYLSSKIYNHTVVHGNLEFEIELHKNGSVKDVSILQSPDKESEPEIIDAIKHGPKWIDLYKEKKDRKKVSLKF